MYIYIRMAYVHPAPPPLGPVEGPLRPPTHGLKARPRIVGARKHVPQGPLCGRECEPGPQGREAERPNQFCGGVVKTQGRMKDCLQLLALLMRGMGRGAHHHKYPLTRPLCGVEGCAIKAEWGCSLVLPGWGGGGSPGVLPCGYKHFPRKIIKRKVFVVFVVGACTTWGAK